MIKINLLGEDTRADFSQHLVLGGYIASLIALVGVCIGAGMWMGAEIADLEDRKVSLEQELKRLQTITQEVKDIEKKQKDLEQRIIRIAMLKLNKQGPVKVLDAINKSVPERAWLMDVKERGGQMRLTGVAMDGETVSEFLRELEKSEHFPKVELDFTRGATRQGVKLQDFAIKAEVSYAGRVTVPPGVSGTADPASDKKATRKG